MATIKVDDVLVINNWLDGQYCYVTILRLNVAEGRIRVGFPNGSTEWLHRDIFDLAPEDGFRQWDGNGPWAV